MARLNRVIWFCILVLSIFPLICSFMQMEFMKKSTGLISVGFLLPLYLFSTILPCIVGYVGWTLESDPAPKKLFRGQKRTVKIIGTLLLVFFGNLGLYYFSVKSVACMLTFLFLAVYFLSILCCIQPGTDFGILELILSASLNLALSRFGFRNFYSCLVLVACIFIDGIRYWQDPEREEHQLPVASNGTEENQLSITETSDGTEENQLSIKVQGGPTDSLAGEETLGSIGNTNIGGGVSIGNTNTGGDFSIGNTNIGAGVSIGNATVRWRVNKPIGENVLIGNTTISSHEY